MKTVVQNNAETVSTFIEAITNRDQLITTDQFFSKQFEEAFPDHQHIVDELIAQGNKIIAIIQTTATHKGLFAGNPSTGNTVVITQFREFHLVEGAIVEQRGWFDTSTLLPQLQTKK
ncbi:ester cyclase [Paenibacillus sp. GSMTC-2017]|uniref:ester cyclase n=1 Tax=Paenibacillus sp. GSMTC-2017 TaxID=2794350 RepID=UPI0018D98745|nr:ester cyclase [Paenibacillus sp. GSMTC-2017]MBH5317575.1 ester cyclase [Paenibacillus sp. GSMTC-2017]